MFAEIDQIPEGKFAEHRDNLLRELNGFRNQNDWYATKRAVQVIEPLTDTLPDSKIKAAQKNQILEDLRTYPLWEAGVLTIKEYVPWQDVDYMTHQESVNMSRILLRIAAHCLRWLKEDRTGFVQIR